MNGPDSISDPVAHRLCCTESYPSARGSARLHNGSAQLSSTWLGSQLMMWQVGPTLLTCLLTGRWCGWWHGMSAVHADITLTSGWCHPWHAYCACWHHNCVILTSLLSGSAMWVGSSGIRVGQPIRVKKTRGQTPCQRVMESAAMSDVRFWRRFHQWLRLVLLYTVVWSKHNFDNFYFWAKIKHHFKP